MALKSEKLKSIGGSYAASVTVIILNNVFYCDTIDAFINNFNSEIKNVARLSTAICESSYKVEKVDDVTAIVWKLSADGDKQSQFYKITSDGKEQNLFNF